MADVKTARDVLGRLVMQLGLVLIFVPQCAARHIEILPMPASEFVDTEVSTNIVLRARDFKVREMSLRIQLDGTPTNDLEVAFGCDSNTNGLLDAAETDVVYGWRAGRYFIENVREWERLETGSVDNQTSCVFDVLLHNSDGVSPKLFAAECGGIPAFGELSSNLPQWLFRREWNMMRAVRRGGGGAFGWIECDVDNHPMIVRMR